MANLTEALKSPLSPYSTPILVLASIYNIVGVLFAFLGNGLVLVSSIKYRSIDMDKTSIILLQNLAVADFLIALLSWLPTTVSTVARRWLLGDVVCFLSGLVVYVPVLVELFILTVISCHKVYTLLYPLHSRQRHVPRSTVIALVGVIWLTAVCFLLLCIVMLGQNSVYHPRTFSCKSSHSEDTHTETNAITVAFLVVALPALITIIIANLALLPIVSRHNSKKYKDLAIVSPSHLHCKEGATSSTRPGSVTSPYSSKHSREDSSKSLTVSVENSGKQTISRENSGKQTISRESSGKQHVSRENSGKQTVSRENSGKHTVYKDNSGKQAISRENSGKQAVSRENSGKQTVSRENSGKQNVSRENSGKQRVARQNSEHQNLSRESSGKQRVSREGSGKSNIAKQSPKEETNARYFMFREDAGHRQHSDWSTSPKENKKVGEGSVFNCSPKVRGRIRSPKPIKITISRENLLCQDFAEIPQKSRDNLVVQNEERPGPSRMDSRSQLSPVRDHLNVFVPNSSGSLVACTAIKDLSRSREVLNKITKKLSTNSFNVTKKAVLMVSGVSWLFIISIMPLTIQNLLTTIKHQELPAWFTLLQSEIYYLNVACNPVIYTLHSTRFRSFVSNVVRFQFRNLRTRQVSDNSGTVVDIE